MKEETLNWCHIDTKDHEGLLWAIIYQQTGKPTQQSPRNIPPFKTESWIKRKSEQTNHQKSEQTNRQNSKILTDQLPKIKTAKQREVKDKMASRVNSTKLRRININPSQTVLRYWGERHISSITVIPKQDKDTIRTNKQKTTGWYPLMNRTQMQKP